MRSNKGIFQNFFFIQCLNIALDFSLICPYFTLFYQQIASAFPHPGTLIIYFFHILFSCLVCWVTLFRVSF